MSEVDTAVQQQTQQQAKPAIEKQLIGIFN